MARVRGLTVVAASLVAALSTSAVSSAAAPPNRHDPCARAGRDSCGTLGVGFYRVYRYGLRWFGDYRGAVPGARHLFCLDLGYWYASRGYRYRLQAGSRLRNRAGRPVSVERQRRIAYAIWRYGRSENAHRQAAVMLYVHAMMGDARPGEIDPSVLGPAGAPLYRRIAKDAPRLHGPYRIVTRLPDRLQVGQAATATIRVLSAHGSPLPYVRMSLSALGASGAPGELRTDAEGVARVALTPTTTAGLRLRLVTVPLAASRPRVYAPTAAAARGSGQRLAAPAGKPVAATVVRTDVGASPRITTHVSTPAATVGAEITDTVEVSGLGGASMPVQVELWGPYERRPAIRCSGTPYWTGSFLAQGDGSTTTVPVRLDRAGYYVYQASIVAHPPNTGFVTACREADETTVVRAHPTLATAVPARVVRPGSTVADRLRVRGLGTTPAAVEVELFGPFGSRAAVRCSYRHLDWHGRIGVQGDGNVRTPAVAVRRAGFYVYRERLVGSPLVAGTTSSCPTVAETLLAAPRIVTGRGDVELAIAAPTAGGRTPVRIRIGALGIDAPVSPAGIDLRHGVLGIPTDIHRVGWWHDSRRPGATHGTTLIAGHLDSARAGLGAFFPLRNARRGTLVELVSADGHRYGYRVEAVRTYPKSALPTGIYSRTGPARLVLVTCGGPFDTTTHHYRDNIVVTARPTG